LLQDFPHFLTHRGDRCMVLTPTWGRTYWCGALFCLVADLEIQKATGNRQGLEDAVKALVAAGATKAVAMELKEALRIADRGLERPVLMKLYLQWADSPVQVDLEALWEELGVKQEGGAVRLDASAPGAVLWRRR